MEIRKIKKYEMEEAISLTWKTFLEFEAPDYTEEGIKEFQKCINDKKWIEAKEFWGAFDNGKLLGVIATDNYTHISLFFVDGNYHNKGIGRMLFNKINTLNEDNYMTVNSSLFAHDIYKHLGFIDTDTEQCIHGIKFYPMKLVRKKD